MEHYAKQQAPQLQSGEVLTHRLPSQVWYLTPLITLHILSAFGATYRSTRSKSHTSIEKRMSMLVGGNAELRVSISKFIVAKFDC